MAKCLWFGKCKGQCRHSCPKEKVIYSEVQHLVQCKSTIQSCGNLCDLCVFAKLLLPFLFGPDCFLYVEKSELFQQISDISYHMHCVCATES